MTYPDATQAVVDDDGDVADVHITTEFIARWLLLCDGIFSTYLFFFYFFQLTSSPFFRYLMMTTVINHEVCRSCDDMVMRRCMMITRDGATTTTTTNYKVHNDVMTTQRWRSRRHNDYAVDDMTTTRWHTWCSNVFYLYLFFFSPTNNLFRFFIYSI